MARRRTDRVVRGSRAGHGTVSPRGERSRGSPVRPPGAGCNPPPARAAAPGTRPQGTDPWAGPRVADPPSGGRGTTPPVHRGASTLLEAGGPPSHAGLRTLLVRARTVPATLREERVVGGGDTGADVRPAGRHRRHRIVPRAAYANGVKRARSPAGTTLPRERGSPAARRTRAGLRSDHGPRGCDGVTSGITRDAPVALTREHFRAIGSVRFGRGRNPQRGDPHGVRPLAEHGVAFGQDRCVRPDPDKLS